MWSCQVSDPPLVAAGPTVLLNDTEGPPISGTYPSRHRSRFGLASWLTVVGAAHAVAVVAIFVLFVRTMRGQYVEAIALTGNSIGRYRIADLVGEVLDAISIASLLAATIVIGFIALARRRVLLAIAAVLIVVGSNVTTQFLKYQVFTRPDLDVDDPVIRSINTLPSGHTTVAASVALALVLVLPPALRGTTALLGTGYAALTGVATLTASWHRPSDVVAAFLVVGAWTAAAALLLVLGRSDAARTSSDDAHPIALTVLITAAVGLLAVWGLTVYVTSELVPTPIDTLSSARLFLAYAGGAAGICGAICAVMAVALTTLPWVVPRYVRHPAPAIRPYG